MQPIDLKRPMENKGELTADSAIVIRDAVESDCDDLARLISQVGYPTSAEQFRQRFLSLRNEGSYRTLLAVTGGRPAGLLGMRLGWQYGTDGRICQIVVLVVDESCRSKGIGTTLLRAGVEFARSERATSLNLTSGLQAVAAHAFFARNGFKQTGIRCAYDFDSEKTIAVQ